MPVHNMRFVLVNNMTPRKPSVCTQCSRPLERGYLHDFSTSKRYCGIECYPRSMVESRFVGSISPTTPFELAIAWPTLTVDVASALFDSAWSDHGR
jgi:Mg-chelatase subunit ChlI